VYRVENETLYNGRGPPEWGGNLTAVPDRLLREYTSVVYSPIADGEAGGGEEGGRQGGGWPMVIFGHGMCGPSYFYSELLTVLASWGYVVISDAAQGDCGSLEKSRILNSLSDAIRKMPYTTNVSMTATNMGGELEYLRSRDDTANDTLIVAGHSMGGGAAVMFAGWLAESEPDLLKAAVLVAPWNFARKPEILPSDAVAKLTAPTMVLCSTTDQMAPCEGYAFSSYTPLLIQGLVEIGLPIIFGGNQTYLDTSVLDPEFGRNFAWFGGVTAMFENSTRAINIQIPGVDHLTVASANNGSEALKNADFAIGAFPFLPFTNGDTKNYTDNLPTWFYGINFMNIHAGGNPERMKGPLLSDPAEPATTEDDLVRQASGDWRIYQVGVKRDGEVDVVYRNASYASCLEGRYCGDGEKSGSKS